MTDDTASSVTGSVRPLFWLPIAQALLVVAVAAPVAMGSRRSCPATRRTTLPPTLAGGCPEFRSPAMRPSPHPASHSFPQQSARPFA